MEIDADSEQEVEYSEGATDTDEEGSDAAARSNADNLEPLRPQPDIIDVDLDGAVANDPGNSSGGVNRVYDASCRLHNTPFVTRFPGAAGREYGIEELTEDKFYQNSIGAPGNVYARFSSKMEWEVAKWAKERGPSSTAFTDLMSINGVSKLLYY